MPAGQLPRTQDKMEAGLGWGWGQSPDCVGWALRGGPGLVLQPLKGQCSEPAAGSPPTPAGVAQEKDPFLPRVFSPECSFHPWRPRLVLGFLPVHWGDSAFGWISGVMQADAHRP